MVKDLTELVFIIDKSGSMRHLTESTIDGFNEVIMEQKETPGEKRVTLVFFNHDPEMIFDRIPISEVLPLTEDDYEAKGNTALLDALQITMNIIGNNHIAEGEKNLPENTIFFITTDGKENSSHWATEESVKASIEYHKEKDGWEFVFLAANLDAVSTAARYGIDQNHAVTYYNDAIGTNLKFRAMNKYIHNTLYKVEENDWADDVKADYETRSKT